MDGGDSNGEDERREREMTARGKVGVPEHETSQFSEPNAIVGSPPVHRTPLVETNTAIIANTKFSECILGEKPDFQLVLQEID
nr:hypothetical protein CFP56_66549 [Quercus suber]